ncbi:MAG: hypothetical protein RSF87_11575 [Cellulosilyticaceae bacterium]
MPVSIFHGMIVSLKSEEGNQYIMVNFKDQMSYFNLEGDFVKGAELPKLQASCIGAWAVIEKESIKANFENLEQGNPTTWIEPLDL